MLAKYPVSRITFQLLPILLLFALGLEGCGKGYVLANTFRSILFIGAVAGTSGLAVSYLDEGQQAARFQISGRVTGASAVTIVLTGPVSSEVSVNDGQVFLFDNLPAGIYTVEPRKTGFFFNPSRWQDTISGNITNLSFLASAASYQFSTKWGSKGSATGTFDLPSGVGIDIFGDLLVTDFNMNRIQKFSPAGDFRLTWGTTGEGDGLFNHPTDIDVATNGNVYVVENGGNRVQVFNSTGTFVQKWGSKGAGDGQFDSPYGIAVDTPRNAVYVADTGNNRIEKFTLAGAFVKQWGGPSAGTSPLADGKFNQPTGVAVDSQGFVYVADRENHRIQKFDSDGTFIVSWPVPAVEGSGSGQFSRPHTLALDSSGNLYVLEFGGDRVQKLRPNFSHITTFADQGQIFGASGIAVDSTGVVYIGNTNRNEIRKYTPAP